MGRIAEALKKAQQERDHRLQVGLRENHGSFAGWDIGRDSVAQTATPSRFRQAVGAEVTMPSPALSEFRSMYSRRAPIRLEPTPPWDVHPAVVALSDRSSMITEQYRAVRTWLMSQATRGEHNCIAMTSSVPGEGKSVTVANMAAILAEIRHMNVLAVDCDLRQGSLARLFKMTNSPGIADILSGRAQLEEAIAPTPLKNLSFLPAGVCREFNPTELLNSAMISRVFDDIRERFHYVLVDTPPVQRLSDAGVIGSLCSGMIMVVRMHKTSTAMVRQSVNWLQSNNLRVIGCIAAACRASDTSELDQDYNDE